MPKPTRNIYSVFIKRETSYDHLVSFRIRMYERSNMFTLMCRKLCDVTVGNFVEKERNYFNLIIIVKIIKKIK